MNVGDFGNRLVFGTGYGGAGFDLSSFTGLTLTFTKPDNTTLVVTNPAVAVGASPYTLPNGQVFNTHQYVTYSFLAGQVSVAGSWSVRLDYQNSAATPPISFNSTSGTFVVGN